MLNHLRAQISQKAAPRIRVVGDVMLERYLSGSVSRVSPEAPVLRLESTTQRAGGAANVAQHIAALDGQQSPARQTG